MSGKTGFAAQFREDAEEAFDVYYHRFKHLLPTIAKVCLLSTFIDDGIRMYLQYDEQHAFFARRYPAFICTLIVGLNFVVQLLAVAMILAKQQRIVAISSLFFIVVLQTFTYSPLWSWRFFARNAALCGSLFLLFADTRADDSKSKNNDFFTQLPTLGTDNVKDYLLFTGRIMTVAMFFTLIHGNMHPARWVLTIINFVLIVCVCAGIEAKLTSFVLVVILSLENVFMNHFWSAQPWMVDYMRYDFFQTLSVIGGLLLIVCHGAGDLSVDEQKKKN